MTVLLFLVQAATCALLAIAYRDHQRMRGVLAIFVLASLLLATLAAYGTISSVPFRVDVNR